MSVTTCGAGLPVPDGPAVMGVTDRALGVKDPVFGVAERDELADAMVGKSG